jgi:hypothetical protein
VRATRGRETGVWLIAGVLAIGPACASRPPTPSAGPGPVAVAPPAVDCALGADGQPAQILALDQPVDRVHAPRPTTHAERIVFRHVYDTLVRLDCEGHLHPGLARTWVRSGDRNDWVITLRQGARFTDGSPVHAADVVAGWRTRPEGALHPEVARLVRDAVALDERTLLVSLRDPHGDAPRALADASLAVARPPPGAGWPLGTLGVAVIDDPRAPAGARGARLVLVPVDGPADVAVIEPLRVVVAPGGDIRDLLDEGVDVLLTRDRAAIDYADTLPVYGRQALPWHRTYLFASSARDAAAPPLAPGVRASLAATAVVGEARGADDPAWWDEAVCEGVGRPGPPRPVTSGGRIVYDGGDEVARELAERIVGIARGATGDTAGLLRSLLSEPAVRAVQRAAGLSGDDLARALASGTDSGYVTGVDRTPAAPCAAWRRVRADLPWIDAGRLVPLVETRLHAIVRRGVGGLIREHDASVRFREPWSAGS